MLFSLLLDFEDGNDMLSETSVELLNYMDSCPTIQNSEVIVIWFPSVLPETREYNNFDLLLNIIGEH
jgi:hypothetical protein